MNTNDTLSDITKIERATNHLYTLVERARAHRARKSGAMGDAAKRAAFIDYELGTAQARAYVDCMAVLGIMASVEVGAWYAYLMGDREELPTISGRTPIDARDPVRDL